MPAGPGMPVAGVHASVHTGVHASVHTGVAASVLQDTGVSFPRPL